MAHENSVSFEQDGKNVLIPTVVDGKQLTPDEALAQYLQGNNPAMGIFTREDELKAAEELFSQTDKIPFPERKPERELKPSVPFSFLDETSARVFDPAFIGKPKRKPDFETLQMMKVLRENVLETSQFQTLLTQSPVAALGAKGAKLFPLKFDVGADFKGQKGKRGEETFFPATVLGETFPHEPDEFTKKEARSLGLSEHFDEDIIVLSKIATPKSVEDLDAVATLLHEFRHRGIVALENTGIDFIDFFLSLDIAVDEKRKQSRSTSPVELNVFVADELFVRLLGVVSGTESEERVKRYLKNVPITGSLEELLANRDVQLALLVIQRATADLLIEQDSTSVVNIINYLKLPKQERLLAEIFAGPDFSYRLETQKENFGLARTEDILYGLPIIKGPERPPFPSSERPKF